MPELANFFVEFWGSPSCQLRQLALPRSWSSLCQLWQLVLPHSWTSLYHRTVVPLYHCCVVPLYHCCLVRCPHHSSNWTPQFHFPHFRFWESLPRACHFRILARLAIELCFLAEDMFCPSCWGARWRGVWGSRACRACSCSSSRSGSRPPRTSGVAPSSRRLWWATKALALIHSRDIIECQRDYSRWGSLSFNDVCKNTW